MQKRYFKLFCEKIKINTTANKFKMRNEEATNIPHKNNNTRLFQEEEEISAQEKYKEFSKSLKNEEAAKRKEDFEVNKILSDKKINVNEIPRMILKRNFLLNKINPVEPKKSNVEINIDILNKLNLKEPIAIYEMDLVSLKAFKGSHNLFLGFGASSIFANSTFLLNFDILFGYTNFIYFFCYLTNTLSFFTYLLLKKLKTRVITIEYIHEKKTLKLAHWATFSNKVIIKNYQIDDLEIIESDKILEQGIHLRLKSDAKKTFWIGSFDEGIWHQKEFFDSLFKENII